MGRSPTLLGTYRTPRFRYGSIVLDEARGEVEIVGLTAGRIPWPIGKKGRAKSLVLYGALAQAVRRESSVAVCYWWGITAQTVTKWRKALGIHVVNEGTLRLFSARGKGPIGRRAIQAMRKKARDPERREKIAAAKRGKPRPPHVIEALRQSHLGKPIPLATRRKMSASHRKRLAGRGED